MLSKIILIFVALSTVHSQKPSPCPEILSYEPRNSELDRWYAIINLSSREPLRGIWLRIILDRPAELLGTVFGDATSNDNQEFLIRSQNYILEPQTVTPVRFFVKYNAASIVPSISEINLNGRSICSSNVVQGQTERPAVISRPTGSSSSRRTTSSSNSRPRPTPTATRPISENSGTSVVNSRPSSSSNNNNINNNRPVRPANSIANTSPVSNSNNLNTNSDNYNTDSNLNTRPNIRPSSSTSNNRPSDSIGNNSPISSSNNFNTNSDNYNTDVISNTRPNNRPSSSTLNNRPSGSSTNFNSGSDDYNRPSSSNNNYNTGSDIYNNGNDHNQNGNNYNRPTSTNTGSSFGNDRDPDPYNHNSNNFNQGQGSSSSVLSVGGNEEFFTGDFSQVINKPPSSQSSRPNINRHQQCGTVASQPRPLISYGQNTTPGQWPWHAALYHSKGIQLMYTCGGTLVSSRHILTAAHCVTKPHTNRAINPQNILVYLGKYNLKKFGSEIQDKEVADIFVHPEYNYTVYYNDIAILRLAEPAQITNYVRPICLWDEDDNLNEIEGRQGTVVGWGFDQHRELSTTLMQAQMPIVATATCIFSNREFFSQFTSEKSFCAGFRNGTSVCNGDSGGGMVFPKRGTSGSNTVWQIRGLVSVGVALQGQGVCDPSQYIVFTDVAKHTNWIQQVLNNYP